MEEFIGKKVIVRDTTGYSTEGTPIGFGNRNGIEFIKLKDSRQLAEVNLQAGTSDGWKVPGINWIAVHLIAGIHESHIG